MWNFTSDFLMSFHKKNRQLSGNKRSQDERMSTSLSRCCVHTGVSLVTRVKIRVKRMSL